MNGALVPDPNDLRFMRQALALARRNLGCTAPNPAVGCVLVKDGRIIGRGWTGAGGRPHAETEAVMAARQVAPQLLAGATAYVSLEPCSHHGRTPPCTDALIEAGVSRVVAALEDPDPRVAGGGFARLLAANVSVDEGLLRDEAHSLNLGFLLSKTQSRPLVAVKTAHSLDGRIATASGESRWITDAGTRAAGNFARARYDAIAVGRQTAVADNPRLDCRLPGLEQASPIRVVFDSTAALPSGLDLVAAAGQRPTLLICTTQAPAERLSRLADHGVILLQTDPGGDDRVDLHQALAQLAARGITRLLVEGGGTLIAGFLRLDLVDEVISHRAPIILGGDGVAAFGPLALRSLAAAPRFVAGDRRRIGDDLVETLRRQR